MFADTALTSLKEKSNQTETKHCNCLGLFKGSCQRNVLNVILKKYIYKNLIQWFFCFFFFAARAKQPNLPTSLPVLP